MQRLCSVIFSFSFFLLPVSTANCLQSLSEVPQLWCDAVVICRCQLQVWLCPPLIARTSPRPSLLTFEPVSWSPLPAAFSTGIWSWLDFSYDIDLNEGICFALSSPAKKVTASNPDSWLATQKMSIVTTVATALCQHCVALLTVVTASLYTRNWIVNTKWVPLRGVVLLHIYAYIYINTPPTHHPTVTLRRSQVCIQLSSGQALDVEEYIWIWLFILRLSEPLTEASVVKQSPYVRIN